MPQAAGGKKQGRGAVYGAAGISAQAKERIGLAF